MVAKERPKRRRMTAGDRRVLERANKAKISRGLMCRFVEECAKLPKEDRGFEGHTITAIQLTKDREKRMALMFRMEALARLVGVNGDGTPGWTLLETPDGGVLTHEAVFAAAAVEPLIFVRGDVGFARKPFMDRVLALAKTNKKPH